ncbi:substrate-binding domain-containing protein [Pseudomonas matsuisoli]|uniref:ABC transporter substrate-binding protein n=1 Tax=Pseudomonas matsuisoli TaxID=1515666 RepID=A0A917PNI6_9PSED|nr:substrate-binding domain-containing protein [Pseudomonas matsuisoli]GGJ85519.1 ABC transporter substrate-binding protein [Pseudomonas matsuisoli]
MLTRITRSFAAALVALSFATLAQAEELKVMISGGFHTAYEELAPEFVSKNGDTVKTIRGPSMGKSPDAIPNRLERGEHADIVIMVGYALDKLIEQGEITPGSRVELADSRIGAVVRKGQPQPKIDTEDNLRETLLQAKSVAYSDSASGVYVENELFKRLGIQDQLSPKAHKIEKTPVASVVANGKYALGFQQVSELMPEKGATFIGKLPDSVQSVTRFAGAVPKTADHPEKAKALLKYLGSADVQEVVRSTGLDSVE